MPDFDAADEFFSASEVVTRIPVPLLPRCGACGLDKGCRTPRMPVDGRGAARVLIVGEYPGRDEDAEGRPFVGRTGQKVRDAVKECGFDLRADCWATNALICKPDGAPAPASVTHCRPNVFNAIRSLNPEVIILMGGDAVKSLIGHLWKPNVGGIGRWVGWRVPSVELNAWICPTYQPAQMFHDDDPVLESDFKRHLRAAFDLVGSRPHPDGAPDYDKRVEIVTSADAAAARVRRYTSGVVAFDYETTCIKPDAPASEIVCASVCWNGAETIAFPWYGAVKSAMKDLLSDPAVAKIGHNIKFEDRWTRAKLGTDVRGWMWDGMLAAHCLDPRGGKEGKEGRKDGAGITGLKFQAFAKLGVPDHSRAVEPFFHSKGKSNYAPNRVRDVKLEQLLKYCGLDSLYEYELAQIQMKEIGW